ncbi:pirin-like C-terminal cupin domain-containing protein [Ochrobactrum sp. SFR4]|uniref:pirin family protein n=1 Tax=Ochrobactrum sp. SFR4 TaxID=2717368 RepID=UPI001C8C6D7E|nr:pirin-like C-terminal cupin domain-containing protein [Ochrobactrum sp. SFR4]MBX8825993.1 pirin family protein [Ochrobactrum sp. SFR4]
MRKVLGVYSSPRPHWVGDGFPARSIFSYASHGDHVSPFLLLDYAGPAEFKPAAKGSDHRRGVGIHPHRGFERVTLVYQGELEHRDSTGNGGTIGAGGAGSLRVIAGTYNKIEGPARTFTPVNLWDVSLRQNMTVTLPIPDGHTAMLVVLSGAVTINDDKQATEAQLVLLDRKGTDVRIEAQNNTSFLVLSGEPIDEPVVIHGPFVMNSTEEISSALRDFQNGHFGKISVS